MSRQLAIGLDFGTNGVRALLVDTANGDELAQSVYGYPSGHQGVLLGDDPNLARQNPADYVSGIHHVLKEVVAEHDPGTVVGIGVDTTGSSPMPLDRSNQPLGLLPQFGHDLAAQCWLWKDHTSHAEAAEITEMVRKMGLPYLAKCGGTYSSEWFWSKILHCLRGAPEVFEAAYTWAECCDWVTAYLCGKTEPAKMLRSICAAGHKAMYSSEWGGLPSREFLAALDPKLAALRDRLYDKAWPSNTKAGGLSEQLAALTGLPVGIPVAVGAIDAHFGAVGSGVRPGVLVKIMGTSTCDCMVHPSAEAIADVPGLCGIAEQSILPNYYGLEAGQCAVGDIFNWFVEFSGRSHEDLTGDASKLKPGQSGLLGLDWNNGNRSVLTDPLLTGLLLGQTLRTTPAEVYRALIEATAFGALKIVRRAEEYGIRIDEIVACGGIADKSELVMQIYADVLNRPVKISRSDQTCALGGAIFASVVAGVYLDAEAAQDAMTGYKQRVFTPQAGSVAVYQQLYALYEQVHDAFGISDSGTSLHNVMKALISIREDTTS